LNVLSGALRETTGRDEGQAAELLTPQGGLLPRIGF